MNIFQKFYQKIKKSSVWARPNMDVTFRAEIMPGKNREERTFQVEKVLANGRVILYGFEGEHRETSFESVNNNR
jgi:hypothetical protein